MSEKRRFLRVFFMTASVLSCIMILCYGIGTSFEKMREIGFGEYKKAVEINPDSIRILDFEFEL